MCSYVALSVRFAPIGNRNFRRFRARKSETARDVAHKEALRLLMAYRCHAHSFRGCGCDRRRHHCFHHHYHDIHRCSSSSSVQTSTITSGIRECNSVGNNKRPCAISIRLGNVHCRGEHSHHASRPMIAAVFLWMSFQR